MMYGGRRMQYYCGIMRMSPSDNRSTIKRMSHGRVKGVRAIRHVSIQNYNISSFGAGVQYVRKRPFVGKHTPFTIDDIVIDSDYS